MTRRRTQLRRDAARGGARGDGGEEWIHNVQGNTWERENKLVGSENGQTECNRKCG